MTYILIDRYNNIKYYIGMTIVPIKCEVKIGLNGVSYVRTEKNE